MSAPSSASAVSAVANPWIAATSAALARSESTTVTEETPASEASVSAWNAPMRPTPASPT